MEPAPIRPDAPRRPRVVPLFVLGVVIGTIPLAIWLGTLGIVFGVRRPPGPGPYVNLSFLFDGLALAGLAYLVMTVAALGLAANERTRVVGMGTLAALIASPVIAYVGCTVIPNVTREGMRQGPVRGDTVAGSDGGGITAWHRHPSCPTRISHRERRHASCSASRSARFRW